VVPLLLAVNTLGISAKNPLYPKNSPTFSNQLKINAICYLSKIRNPTVTYLVASKFDDFMIIFKAVINLAFEHVK